MVILVLELLHDVHQVDVGLLNIEIERIDSLECVARLEVQIVRFRNA